MEDLLRCIVLVKHLECNFGISRYEPVRNDRTELVLISSITQLISLWNSPMIHPSEHPTEILTEIKKI